MNFPFGLNATHRPPSGNKHFVDDMEFSKSNDGNSAFHFINNIAKPFRLSFVSSLDRFCKICEKVILNVSVYHNAVFTIVQFVTLPSPAIEYKLR